MNWTKTGVQILSGIIAVKSCNISKTSVNNIKIEVQMNYWKYITLLCEQNCRMNPSIYILNRSHWSSCIFLMTALKLKTLYYTNDN